MKCCKNSDYQKLDEGQIICINCGKLIEESNLMYGSAWIKNKKNQFINQNSVIYCNINPKLVGSNYYSKYEYDPIISKENSRLKGQEEIQKIYNLLKLSGHEVLKCANKFFRLAIEFDKIKGRRRDMIAASCLYMACREKHQSILLIDFCNILKINIHILGRIFRLFCKELHVSIESINPENILKRYCHHPYLNFGSKKYEIWITSMRIMTHMRFNWIFQGRTPSGVLGACVFLASQMHGFENISEIQLADICKVCENTIRKRVIEFHNTKVANFTCKEWNFLKGKDESLYKKRLCKISKPPSMKIKRKENFSIFFKEKINMKEIKELFCSKEESAARKKIFEKMQLYFI